MHNKIFSLAVMSILLLFTTPVVASSNEVGSTSEENSLRGTVEAVSSMASMLQLSTAGGAKVVLFDEKTSLSGIKSIGDIPIGAKLAVEYHLRREGLPLATSVQLTAQEAVLKDNQISPKALFRLLADKTTPLTLVDVRAISAYKRGHIPTAISIYNGKFKENVHRLPVNKDQLLVYYCEGTA